MSSTLADQQRAVLDVVAEVEAEGARLFARQMVLRAEMERLWNPPVGSPQEQFGVLELAGTARIGQSRASSQLVDAVRLVEDLPGTLAALQAGRMFVQTALLLLQQTRNCAPQVTREVERRLLPVITQANTTEVRRLLADVIPEVEADLDPVLTEERLASARARRSVWQADHGDGLVATIGQSDAVSAKRWMTDFEELVRAQKIADDKAGVVRSADQRRADVFVQLPSRLLALLHAIRSGDVDVLLSLAQEDPDLADQVEALAATLPDELLPVADERLAEESLAEPALEPELLGDPDLINEATVAGGGLELLEEIPLPPEPPSDELTETEPADPTKVGHWTELSSLELASTVMGLPVRNPIVLNVHVPMTTLLELDNRTARTDQGGALPASLVRSLVPEASLRRVLVDAGSGIPIGLDPTLHPPRKGADPPTSGKTRPPEVDPRLVDLLSTAFELVETAEPRHDPSRRLRQLIDLRDQICTGIGCAQPARLCHHDHEDPYPDGPTAGWNLSAKSARCHRAKHAGWTVTRHGPSGGPRGEPPGSSTWTSPLGRTYTKLGPWTRPSPALACTGEDYRLEVMVEIKAYVHAA